MSYGQLIPDDFARLLLNLQKTEYVISDNFAKIILIQFNLHKTLLTDGKLFFKLINKPNIVDFITMIENKEYDKIWSVLADDLSFAVSMANTAKEFPDLRKVIIENLPNDTNIQKEKLLLLLNYDEKNIKEAFELPEGIRFIKFGISRIHTLSPDSQREGSMGFCNYYCR